MATGAQAGPQGVERNELMEGDKMDIEKRSRSVPWYVAEPTSISNSTRALFEQYSKIPPEQVESHILAVRERAWQIHPYPCLGRFSFLSLSIEQTDVYSEILQRLKSGAKMLDLGCCFGQEIRKLVADGAPSENIYGADLERSFWDLGYDLFEDRQTLKTRFIQADIFDGHSALGELKGTLDIVYTGSFFHLFDYARQVQAGRNVARFLKPQKGSILVGRQVGGIKAGEREHRTNPKGGTMYRHDVESFQKMWTDIGEDLGLRFSIDARLFERGQDSIPFHQPDTRILRFVIRWE